MRMEDKVVLITGATGGIGTANAIRFLDEGASVFLTGRSPEKLDTLAKKFNNSDKIQSCVVEAIDEAAVERSITQCLSEFGRVDSIIANAGT